VLIPADNEKDLAEIPKNIKDKLEIVPVKWIDEVFELALQHMPQPKTESEALAATETDAKSKASEKTKPTRPH
jgi:ATP-dependent Lon protease